MCIEAISIYSGDHVLYKTIISFMWTKYSRIYNLLNQDGGAIIRPSFRTVMQAFIFYPLHLCSNGHKLSG